MSLLTKLVGGSIAETAKEVADVVDKFVGPPGEKATFKTVAAKMAAVIAPESVSMNHSPASAGFSLCSFLSGNTNQIRPEP